MENEKILDIELELSINADSSIETFLAKKELALFPYKILKKSLDARGFPKYHYKILLSANSKTYEKLSLQKNIKVSVHQKPAPLIFEKVVSKKRVFVIGAGPAGLFASYVLCERGFAVVVLERGKKIAERDKDIAIFYKTAVLNENSNIQFGEGGAGTYSDGKLATRVKDDLKHFVYEVFHKYGAPEDILYDAKPHVGTDIIRKVITAMRIDLEQKGVEFRFSSVLRDIETENGSVAAIEIEDLATSSIYKDECQNLIVACGNSARDTFLMLKSVGAAISQKPIAVGYRVIHPQKDIDFARYPKQAHKITLPPADYALSFNKNGIGVYSFCMCPGGYVINASSKNGMCVINGMSNSKRDSGFANSAVVVAISPSDIGGAVMEFQEKIEKKTFALSSDYPKIPAMLLKDFLEEKAPSSIKQTKAVLPGLVEAPVYDVYSDYPFINSLMREAFIHFNNKMKGKWITNDALILASETRTSSPITMERNENGESVSVKGVFVAGEGSGHAGGITSSAIDGIKVAISIK